MHIWQLWYGYIYFIKDSWWQCCLKTARSSKLMASLLIVLDLQCLKGCMTCMTVQKVPYLAPLCPQILAGALCLDLQCLKGCMTCMTAQKVPYPPLYPQILARALCLDLQCLKGCMTCMTAQKVPYLAPLCPQILARALCLDLQCLKGCMTRQFFWYYLLT